MKHYTQLTQEQRYQIYALMKAGHNQIEIAHMLGVDKSTISREIRRNTGGRGYRPQQAHQYCLQRRTQKVTPDQGMALDRTVAAPTVEPGTNPCLATPEN